MLERQRSIYFLRVSDVSVYFVLRYLSNNPPPKPDVKSNSMHFIEYLLGTVLDDLCTFKWDISTLWGNYLHLFYRGRNWDIETESDSEKLWGEKQNFIK